MTGRRYATLGSFIIEFNTARAFDEECSAQIKRTPVLSLETLEETGPTRRGRDSLSADCLLSLSLQCKERHLQQCA